MKKISIIAFALVLGFVISTNIQSVKSAGISNTIGYIATSSTIVVGPQQVKTIFTSSTFCQSRLIGTVSQPVMLSFSSAVTPSQFVGFQVAASTTKELPPAIYGCGDLKVYAVASTTITIAGFIQ